MRDYPNQPSGNRSAEGVKKVIEEVLKEELPECETNRWFLDSVHFANMLDEVIRQLTEGEVF